MIMISFGSVVEWVVGSFAVGFLCGTFFWAYLYTKYKLSTKNKEQK